MVSPVLAPTGREMSRKRPQVEGSYQRLDAKVVACLQGRADVEPSVRAILDAHAAEQIKAVLLDQGERYRRFNRARFTDLVERLRQHGVLW